ncbi:MAG: A/G-specific adenine glycosylase, partial [Phycisphaerae bacterium]|nr:A/G-specific adenine glycosylase [Phycisphaerae bacterium]
EHAGERRGAAADRHQYHERHRHETDERRDHAGHADSRPGAVVGLGDEPKRHRRDSRRGARADEIAAALSLSALEEAARVRQRLRRVVALERLIEDLGAERRVVRFAREIENAASRSHGLDVHALAGAHAAARDAAHAVEGAAAGLLSLGARVARIHQADVVAAARTRLASRAGPASGPRLVARARQFRRVRSAEAQTRSAGAGRTVGELEVVDLDLLVASGEQVDRLHLEHQLVLVAKLLELAAAGHCEHFVRALAELLRRFLEGVEQLHARRVWPISTTRKNWHARAAGRIERWFERRARPFPWRRRRTAWRSLVSEVMSQQTQLSRVEERFESFMTRFPTPRALAESSERDVLELWQGLGYYRRARLLREAARAIERDFGGRVPARAQELATLPGVGRYTAGAVASIVHGERVPIVDGNVSRVLLRVLGERRPMRDSRAVRRCWSEAEALVNAARRPGRLNEGLMELGALVCTPSNPKCGECPLRGECRARTQRRADSIPTAPPRAVRPTVVVEAFVIERRGRVLLEQRDGAGMWAGL